IWPPVVLAPMAGETGSVLRILGRRMGAGLVCTELTSSHGLFHGNKRSFEYLRWTGEEHPISAQIFGAEPEVMSVAARMCCEAGADLIDINMGCWVPKVAKTGAGASLLKDLKKAAAVMSAVVKASNVPVTIKTRVGWDGCVGSAVEMARVAESVGVAAIAIHGRTAVQGFTGEADWRPIAEARATVGIPVIGNGDVRTPEDARRMFEETGCDAVMIGRAALGNPWIFRETAAYLLHGRTLAPPSGRERLEIALEHARLMAAQAHGEMERATPLPPVSRGQLIHYITALPGSADARRRMTQILTLGDVEDIVDSLLELDLERVRDGRCIRGAEPVCLTA
ncbi:MAG TPA: tRNA dihydrouridine synthase DusB, partial [Armatimonadota bacterium]|nr:tRNA dihydrouridine synthase DusB [Armatimonadota bacterium]